VNDVTPPVLKLKGAEIVHHSIDENYIDAGATAHDDNDGDISHLIEVVGDDFAIDEKGSYTVTYAVKDVAGNKANATRVVHIVDPSNSDDTTPPIIVLKGSNSVTLTVGEIYSDAGVTASDDVDGNITANIVTVNPVNAATAGIYTVTYNVSDAAGNAAVQITRVVEVKEENIPNPNAEYPWDHGKLEVAGRMLKHHDGTGFFWLADTAWALPSKMTNREDVKYYLDNRKAKGYNIIKISSTFWAPHPFNADYTEEDPILWAHIDFIIDEAKKRGIYIALAPYWEQPENGSNPVPLNTVTAKRFGEWVANRYKNRKNIIWLNGGDAYVGVNGYVSKEIWNIFGSAIRSVVGNKQMITFHPGWGITPSITFNNSDWLDFNMIQTGHGATIDYAMNELFIPKYNESTNMPILDGEARYEGIFKDIYSDKNDGTRYGADDIREIAYREVFSGAFGYTYGHNSIWKVADDNEMHDADVTWKEALNAPGATQIQYLARLMRSRDILSRVPDQSIVAGGSAVATRGDGYAFVYLLPNAGNVTVNLGKISGNQVKAWWYNPRTGHVSTIGTYSNSGTRNFSTSNEDMVLVLDDASKGYGTPGI
jgi:hypothetical protein